jgi:hypothetical protein
LVYNFEYDLDNVDVHERTVIANGIFTLDLLAQSKHHPPETNAKEH